LIKEDIRRVTERLIRIIIVDHPIILLIGLLTYFPITSLLFTIRIMHTRTTGNNTPFATCDHSVISISGAFGSKIIPEPIIIILVKSQ